MPNQLKEVNDLLMGIKTMPYGKLLMIILGLALLLAIWRLPEILDKTSIMCKTQGQQDQSKF